MSTLFQPQPDLTLFPEPVALDALPTPCLLLDVDKMNANIARFKEHWKDSGAALRPHLKTCRSWPVAKEVLTSPQGPCCVATMGEAEAAFGFGARDIVLAVGIRPHLFGRVHALMQQGADIKVLLDSKAEASALAKWAKEHKAAFSVLLEIDCDGHRAGLAPDSPLLAEIADILSAGGQKVAGILTHAGSAYDICDIKKLQALAVQEAEAASRAAALLRAHGHACPIVSVGSTPTGMLGPSRDVAQMGITEVRAGVFVFMDLVMEGLGVCTKDDIALTVLTSLLGGFPEDGSLPEKILTDSGWAALSTDRGLAVRFPEQGYGLACSLDGTLLPGIAAADLNQEHGMLRVAKDVPPSTACFLGSLTPSSKLRILPNHACAAAMMHQAYYLVHNGMCFAKARRFGGW